jgi:hypothetical protein
MRSLLLVLVVASACVASALPSANLAVCDADKVQLELRPDAAFSNYQLAFVAIDPNFQQNKADFVDIHYRVNNEDSVNLRVLTEAAMTTNNEQAKQAQIDNIQLDAGDVLRAYATYSSRGIACDTAIHTFNAPDSSDIQQMQYGRGRTMRGGRGGDFRSIEGGFRRVEGGFRGGREGRGFRRGFDEERRGGRDFEERRGGRGRFDEEERFGGIGNRFGRDNVGRFGNVGSRFGQTNPNERINWSMDRDINTRFGRGDVDLQTQAYTPVTDRRYAMRMSAEDAFWTQAAIEAETNHAQGACPAVALDQDVLKMSGLRDSYVLQLENKTPAKQLQYVDLHLVRSSDPDQEWENLRLASDMQLDHAHKVMQPGVVIRPNEQLSFYWSYRAQNADGIAIDCTTPITTVSAGDVTHEVDLKQILQRQ